MVRTATQPILLESNRHLLVGWAILVALVLVAVAVVQRQSLTAELQTEAAILHRLASQRADQHDAHMTSLSALAVAGADQEPDLFLQVAATIQRFYPRIGAVDLVPLATGGRSLSTRDDLPAPLADTIRSAARNSDGQLALHPMPELRGNYLMVKRSPNSDAARFGLAMQIDGNALLFSDSEFWQRPSVTRTLVFPKATNSKAPPLTAMQFEKPLGSASQPLVFQASMSPGMADLLRPGTMLSAAILASLLYFAVVLALRQLIRARRAERQARLSAQEARLAHASRVNALGEMASGMAHELTQPLTAVLSLAQAGRHLSERGDMAGLRASIDSIVVQTKRASAILERLRNWTRPQQAASGSVSVNEVAANVRLLLLAEAERAGIDLALRLDPGSRQVLADAVEVEQVLFNLVRNSMDVVAGADRRQVLITTRPDGPDTVIEVTDWGPGVDPDIRSRLFEPFVTGKPDGTGLGLALCQRLVDRMGGDIALDEGAGGTTFRVRLPGRAEPAREAAE